MAFGRKKNEPAKIVIPESGELHKVVQEDNNEEVKTTTKNIEKLTDKKTEEQEKKLENVEKEVKKVSIKKNAKVIANGRCFGSASLECPLKTVRNYETKIIDIDKAHNSVLIDEGWISLNNIK